MKIFVDTSKIKKNQSVEEIIKESELMKKKYERIKLYEEIKKKKRKNNKIWNKHTPQKRYHNKVKSREIKDIKVTFNGILSFN